MDDSRSGPEDARKQPKVRQQERQARLAEALRANLKRRKAQERARSTRPGPAGTGGDDGAESDKG